MRKLSEKDALIVNALAENFYKVVPPELRTYCAVSSRISIAVLAHFGIEAALLPCQVWCVTPESNFVMGFLGESAHATKWNGHVVCCAGDFIIDAALHHFSVDFGVAVPLAVTTRRFAAPTQVIARFDLDGRHRLWWHCPPNEPGIDLNIPDEPLEIIAKYSAQLIEHLSALGIGAYLDPRTLDLVHAATKAASPKS